MAALTWYLTNNSASVGSDLSLTDPGTEATRSPTTGWVVGTGSTNRSAYFNDTERAASTFDATTYPDGSLDTTNGDFWVSPTALTGDFASGNWTVNACVRATSSATGQDGRMYCRLFRGPNQDGSSATEITAAAQTGSNTTDLLTTVTQNSSVTFNPGAFSVSAEYIFVQLAWERFGAASMTTADVNFRIGNASSLGSSVVTADFSATITTALSAAGASTATSQGGAVATANLSATAASTATASGAALAEATLSAPGASTATAEGGAIVFATFDLDEAGLSTATAVGASSAGGELSAAGAAAATAKGAATIASALEATGTSTATAEGAATATGDLSATGASTAVAEGAEVGGTAYASTDLSAAGSSTATAEGAATAGAELGATGASTATLEAEAVGGAPAVDEDEPTSVSEGPGGGMWTRNPWADQKRKKRRQDELDELDMLVIAQAAVQQLAADHMRRAGGG